MTKKESKSKEVSADWKEALKKQVAVTQAAKAEVNGIPHISLKGGRMSLNDQYIPGDDLQCIILASTVEKSWYDRPYDPDDNSPPDCFALGKKQSLMEPHENVPMPPSDNCKSCPMAEYGTARQGKGPACKTRMRLLVMPVPDNVTADMIRGKEAEMAIYKTQPTSTVNFNGAGGAGKAPGYQKVLAEQGITPWAVISKVRVLPHNKKLHETTFHLVKPLTEDDLLAAAFSRCEQAELDVAQPYTYPEADENAPDAAPAQPTGESADGVRY